MSHFTVMVIGEDPEKQLAPYSEHIEVDEYCTGCVTDDDKQSMLDYYNKERETPYKDFDECYAENGEDWNNNRYHKNEEGVWCEYSTYNPKSKWDWYLLGGRWSGEVLQLKEGATSGIEGEASWCSYTHGIDAALKKDIDFEAMYAKWGDDWCTYAIVKDGEWYALGKMGWWCISTNEITKEEWCAKAKELLASVPDDTLISIYDCHI